MCFSARENEIVSVSVNVCIVCVCVCCLLLHFSVRVSLRDCVRVCISVRVSRSKLLCV